MSIETQLEIQSRFLASMGREVMGLKEEIGIQAMRIKDLENIVNRILNHGDDNGQ